MVDSILFQGSAFGLNPDELARVSTNLGVHAAEIWTVLTVETSGCGFLPIDVRKSYTKGTSSIV
jgi:hypothetical protein